MNTRRFFLTVLTLAILIGSTGAGWIQVYAATSAPPNILTQKITGQVREDISLGKSGVFMPSSAYTANLTLTRSVPGTNYQPNDIRFTQRWTEISLKDSQGAKITQVFGINYVYFTLNGWERRAWDAGLLSIYQFDTDKNKWVVCPFTHLVDNKNAPRGRLTCVFTKFGVFGLGGIKV
jgi:hypothetical protein